MKYCIALIFSLIFISQISAQTTNSPTRAIGDSLFKKGDYINAAKYFTLASEEESNKVNPDKATIAWNLEWSAYSYSQAEDYGRAIELYKQALLSYAKNKDKTNFLDVVEQLDYVLKVVDEKSYPLKIDYTKSDEPEFWLFKITEILKKNFDSVFVKIAGGKFDGLIEKSKGTAQGMNNSISGNRRELDLGAAVLISVNVNSSTALIIQNDSTDEKNKIYIGDVIKVPVYKLYKNNDMLHELALMNIEFTSDFGKKFISSRIINYFGNAEVENYLFEMMKADVIETWEWIRDSKDSTWVTPASSGRFKGKKMIEAMDNSSADDIRSFLKYTVSFPETYMGKTWRIPQAYAGWVLVNAPIGSSELKDKLSGAKSEKEFNQILETYQNDLSYANYYYFDVWLVESEKNSNENKFNEALNQIDLLIKIGKAENSKVLLGKALYSKGNIYQNTAQYKEAIGYYQQAKDVFAELAKTDSSESNCENLAKAKGGIAAAYYNLSEYENARTNYFEAIDIYNKTKTLFGLSEAAGSYHWIGRSFEKQGKYEDAISNYKKSGDEYSNLGNHSQKAESLDDIGYVNYLLGNYSEAYKYYSEAYEYKMKLGNKDGAGFSKSNMAQMLWDLGDYNKAIESHEEAIKLRKEAKNKAGEAYSLKKIGGLYGDSGDPVKAISNLTEALKIYKELDDKKEIADVYKIMGDTYNNIKDFESANTNYSEALKIYELMNSKSDVASLLASIGNCFYDNKKYKEAFTNYQKSLGIQKEIGDKSGQMYNYINMGLVLQFFNVDLKESENNFNNALATAKEIGSEEYIAYCKSQLSSLYTLLGKANKSLALLDEALKYYEGAKDKNKQAEVLLKIAYLYSSNGEFDKTKTYFDSTITVASVMNNKLLISDAYEGLANMQRMLGEYKIALNTVQKSYELYKEVDNKWGLANYYINIGNIFGEIGENEKAIHNYNLSDSLYKELGSEVNRTYPMNNIGTIYQWQENYDGALKKFQDALSILNKFNVQSDFTITVTSNIGEIYYLKKSFDESEKYLNEALQMANKIENKRNMASIKDILGKLELERGNLDKAKILLQDAYGNAKQSGIKGLTIETATYLGKLNYQNKNYDTAKIYLNEAIELSRIIETKKSRWEALYYLAKLNYEAKNIDGAISELKEAIDIVEEMKSKVTGGDDAMKIFTSSEHITELYEFIVKVLLETGKTEDAFGYLQRANNENLRDKFQKMNVKFDDNNKNEALITEKEKKLKLEQINSSISKEKEKPEGQQNTEFIKKLEEIKTVAEKDYRSFLHKTIVEYPSLSNHFKDNVNPEEFRAEKRNIPEDCAALLYLIGDNNLYIFVATRDSVFAKVITVAKGELDEKIVSLYNLIKSPASTVRGAKVTSGDDNDDKISKKDKIKNLSDELYQILISPVESAISGKKKLAIIPNGALYFLPFQALTYNENKEVKYLNDKYLIYYINKMKFINSNNRLNSDIKLVAIGNADNSLPKSEIEVKNIKNIYPDANIFLRESATKQNLLTHTDNHNILHLATHGILDYNDFEKSYLKLAPDPKNNDDGELKVSDIYRISNFDSYEMVTLSACETAVTKEVIEGMPVSTASAFLGMGVQTVIASLWSVDDEATSILMTRFYENVKTMSKLEALEEAQSYLSKNEKYSAPYYWAPFILVGNWK